MATKTGIPNGYLSPVAGGANRWSDGFFSGLFERSISSTRKTLRMALWHEKNSATFENFKTAARLQAERKRAAEEAAGKAGGNSKVKSVGGTGDWDPAKVGGVTTHQGTNWSDGDCYKYIEGLSHLYAALDAGEVRDGIKSEMDDLIPIVAAAQEEDGYLNTQIQIPGKPRWVIRLHHEDYNLGHMFTAAAVHHAATGEDSFLAIARKAADCTYDHFIIRRRDAGQFGWNPVHIPGLVDLYRATGEKRYLELALVFLDHRGAERPIPIESLERQGPDDENQMAVPFREETEAVGHAVTAAYLYLGASELYRETGDKSIMDAAERIWRDVIGRKLYLTGAVGALPVGISKRGYKVWEAFGREYELPHRTGYNETCANIAWGMFCRSMYMITGGAEYADEMERVVYNCGLSGLSTDGGSFCYANPLRWYTKWDTADESFGTMRHFSHDRWQVHTCYCCPPQEFRFIAQLADWAYYTAPGTAHVAFYGAGTAALDIPAAGTMKVRQETSYPWDGAVKLTIDEAPDAEVAICLRIPGWCEGATVELNGERTAEGTSESAAGDAGKGAQPGSFYTLKRNWKAGDVIELILPMPVRLVTANPKVETCRGQAAVMRGPLVYCAESVDLPDGTALENVALCRDFRGKPVFEEDLLGGVTTITGKGRLIESGEDGLYRDVSSTSARDIDLRLIPYFAWNNRGHTDMTVWMELE